MVDLLEIAEKNIDKDKKVWYNKFIIKKGGH
jgi:hypothetical protein